MAFFKKLELSHTLACVQSVLMSKGGGVLVSCSSPELTHFLLGSKTQLWLAAAEVVYSNTTNKTELESE